MGEEVDGGRPLAALTLEEKVSLLSGEGYWRTKAVERVDVQLRPLLVVDGPHGLRKEREWADNFGHGSSWPATCFPTAASLGSSWNRSLVRAVGAALGSEARAAGVSVLLGPGVNIKRTPLGGRNFEYFSEDPVVSGDLGGAWIEGVQSEGVGASLKHFAVNNQESDRMRVSADVDERPLREIYLTAFERAVKAGPFTVMAAYNRVNGVYATEHAELLSDILRGEWGWDGLVMSDWGAIRDRVASLIAGTDLEMPSSSGRHDALVVDAVRTGRIAEAAVDQALSRLVDLATKTSEAAANPRSADLDAHHALAREVAAEGTVLLKNDEIHGRALLPLSEDGEIAVVGLFARTPRYQGAGSSKVNPTRVDAAYDVLEQLVGTSRLRYAAGFSATADVNEENAAVLRNEAVDAARSAHTTVLFLGLPETDESEGYDRTELELPEVQRQLLDEVSAVTDRVVVVLSNGGVLDVAAWRDRAGAIVETWLGGQAGGAAVADILTGRRNPSGKLAETIPLRLQDTPAFGAYPGEFRHVRYGEGLLVGYRWYDARELEVAYPFGFGLSYTSFDISGLDVSPSDPEDPYLATVRVTLRNSGAVAGAEVVQVYIEPQAPDVIRPPRELKAFEKVSLEPGEERVVELVLDRRSFAYWSPEAHAWEVQGGEFIVAVGTSSRDLPLRQKVVVPDDRAHARLSMLSTLGELLKHPATSAHTQGLVADFPETDLRMAADLPLDALADYAIPGLSRDELGAILTRAGVGA